MLESADYSSESADSNAYSPKISVWVRAFTVVRECDSQVDVQVIKRICHLMQRCDGPGGRCEGPWEGVTDVSILRICLGGVTVIWKVYESSRRCWVEKGVLISPGAMRAIKHVLVQFRKCDSCQGGVTVFNIDCTQSVVFGYYKVGVTLVGK